MDVKFFKCMHCGNIAVKVFDAGVPLVCCGEKMVELVADSQDAALEKHVPAVEVDGEALGYSPFEFGIIDRAVRVVVAERFLRGTEKKEEKPNILKNRK